MYQILVFILSTSLKQRWPLSISIYGRFIATGGNLRAEAWGWG